MDKFPIEQLEEAENAAQSAAAPSEAQKPKQEVKSCPACGRKLLTHTSALCNWCGAKIDDPEYQEKAAQARQANDLVERARIEALMQEEARFGTLGRLRRRAKQGPGNGDLSLP